MPTAANMVIMDMIFVAADTSISTWNEGLGLNILDGHDKQLSAGYVVAFLASHSPGLCSFAAPVMVPRPIFPGHEYELVAPALWTAAHYLPPRYQVA